EGYQHNVILLAGGDAKGANMTELKTSVQQHVKALIVMGKDAPLLEATLEEIVTVYHVETMIDAVEKANQIAMAKDTVLLSPACASLDQYKNYQHRGDAFIAAVRALEFT
ncbi:MAG: UDP-N-acetylmuramoyl-L-alanine--D-glutamate ligase, partial [Methylococcales bacterium]|nr:UDP-N-acetylmuramoyl-L-alanine--D-glutamate ligase [Methylococcales bacterium]